MEDSRVGCDDAINKFLCLGKRLQMLKQRIALYSCGDNEIAGNMPGRSQLLGNIDALAPTLNQTIGSQPLGISLANAAKAQNILEFEIIVPSYAVCGTLEMNDRQIAMSHSGPSSLHCDTQSGREGLYLAIAEL